MNHSDKSPTLSIGIVSYNRFKYLRVLVDSLRECINFPKVEWLLADGGSVEPGLQDYLKTLDDFTSRSVDESHADSLNWLIENASGDILMILPEDIQFIRKGNWIQDAVHLLLNRSNAGCVVFDAQRKSTILSQLVYRDYTFMGRRVPGMRARRVPRTYQGPNGEIFYSAQDSRDGISVAGIMGISRTSLLREIGPFRKNTKYLNQPTNDSSLGAEDDMIARVRGHKVWGKLEAYLMKHPAAVDTMTDLRGTKARVRAKSRRYGAYRSPPNGQFYYQLIGEAEQLPDPPHPFPVWPIELWAKPIGFSLPLDKKGDLRKVSVIHDDEPWADIAHETEEKPWPKDADHEMV